MSARSTLAPRLKIRRSIIKKEEAKVEKDMSGALVPYQQPSSEDESSRPAKRRRQDLPDIQAEVPQVLESMALAIAGAAGYGGATVPAVDRVKTVLRHKVKNVGGLLAVYGELNDGIAIVKADTWETITQLAAQATELKAKVEDSQKAAKVAEEERDTARQQQAVAESNQRTAEKKAKDAATNRFAAEVQRNHFEVMMMTGKKTLENEKAIRKHAEDLQAAAVRDRDNEKKKRESAEGLLEHQKKEAKMRRVDWLSECKKRSILEKNLKEEKTARSNLIQALTKLADEARADRGGIGSQADSD